MKLTRTHLMIGGLIGVLIIAGLLIFHLFRPTTPKDTPIVAGGGSIYGKSSSNSFGWQLYGNNIYDIPVSGSIDYLVISGFSNSPSGPVTGTNGWAISFSNPDFLGKPQPHAVRFCSDAKCSASKVLMDGSTNPSPCTPGSFDPSGPVYFGATRANTHVNPVQSNPLSWNLIFMTMTHPAMERETVIRSTTPNSRPVVVLM